VVVLAPTLIAARDRACLLRKQLRQLARHCLAPADRAASLVAEATRLTDGVKALAKSGLCPRRLHGTAR